MFYTTPVLVFPSNTVIAQYRTYYEKNGYVKNIFSNLSLGHISNTVLIRALTDHVLSPASGRLTMEGPHRITRLITPLLQVFTHIHLCRLFIVVAPNTGAPGFSPPICKLRRSEERRVGKECR